MTELTDLSETDSSNTTITGVNIDEGCAPSGMNNAARSTLGLIRRAFKSSIFRLRDVTDQTKLLAFDLSGLITATTRTWTVPDESGRVALQPHLAGHIYGLTLSNNVTDATNDIDIAVGNAIDSTNSHVMTLASALTKRLDAVWAVGNNAGMNASGSAIGNGSYHIFEIKRPDTGVVDIAADTLSTGANIPANTNAAYTIRRRIGSILRIGGAIKPFFQQGDRFTWVTPINSDTANNPGAVAVLRAVTVPTGIFVDAWITATLAENAVATRALYLSCPLQTDSAPLISTAVSLCITGYANARVSGDFYITAATNSQIRTRLDGSTVNTDLLIVTNGYIDRRDRS